MCDERDSLYYGAQGTFPSPNSPSGCWMKMFESLFQQKQKTRHPNGHLDDPDCCIGMFESLKNKKNGYPKVSVLVRQKGLVCVFAREWAKTDVRLSRAVAGGAHPRRILMFETS